MIKRLPVERGPKVSSAVSETLDPDRIGLTSVQEQVLLDREAAQAGSEVVSSPADLRVTPEVFERLIERGFVRGRLRLPRVVMPWSKMLC